jgi:hypothetical protein
MSSSTNVFSEDHAAAEVSSSTKTGMIASKAKLFLENQKTKKLQVQKLVTKKKAIMKIAALMWRLTFLRCSRKLSHICGV